MSLISLEEPKFKISSEHVVCVEFMSMRFVPGLISATVLFLSTPDCEGSWVSEKQNVVHRQLCDLALALP